MLGYILGIYPLDASSTTQVMTTKFVSRCYQMSSLLTTVVLDWKPLPYSISSQQLESTEHTPSLSQCFCTCWDPSGELQWLTLLNKGRANCLSVLQSAGRVPAPFSIISVCYPLRIVLNIYKLPVILPSVPQCIKGRWEVILKLASVLFLSYESVFSGSHSFRR